jgi:hypothetical protein
MSQNALKMTNRAKKERRKTRMRRTRTRFTKTPHKSNPGGHEEVRASILDQNHRFIDGPLEKNLERGKT